MMRHWHDFLDSIDTNGGHIMVLLLLMVMAAIAFRNGFPKAEDIAIGAFGALLLALKESGSNKERRDTAIVMTKTETVDKPSSDEPQAP